MITEYKLFLNSVSANLFLDLAGHFLLAIPLGILFWKKTNRFYLALIPLIVTFAIDLDHLVDYWGFYGMRFNLSDFLRVDYLKGPGIAFVPLHAWEWIMILTPTSIKRGWNSAITAINLGAFVHIALDSVMVGSFIFYSIIYRYLVGFRIFM